MYVEPRKMVQMSWFAGQKLRHRCRQQTYGHQWGETAVGWGWQKAWFIIPEKEPLVLYIYGAPQVYITLQYTLHYTIYIYYALYYIYDAYYTLYHIYYT